MKLEAAPGLEPGNKGLAVAQGAASTVPHRARRAVATGLVARAWGRGTPVVALDRIGFGGRIQIRTGAQGYWSRGGYHKVAGPASLPRPAIAWSADGDPPHRYALHPLRAVLRRDAPARSWRTSISQALASILEMRSLLNWLGRGDARLALRERCAEALMDAGAAAERTRLRRAMHALERQILAVFLEGRGPKD